ncbi:MAG: cation:proton antiporter [Phycisphaerae bacterium]
MDSGTILFELVAVVALGGAAQWLAWRLRLPSILLLLLFGFLAGPVTNLLHPDEVFGGLLLPLVSLSVAVILFEGGLTLNFRELRATGNVVRRLVTVGALATWAVAAVAARLIVGLEWRLALLLGALLIVTGPTVIIPLLRHVRPSGPVGPVLKWEGIVIDPVGALLTVLVFEVLFAGNVQGATAHVALALLKTVVVGGGLGLLAAGLLAVTMARFWIPEFLHNAVALGLVCLAHTLSNAVQPESGLLAVTVMGIALANQRIADIRHVLEFKENLRVLLISALFIILAAQLPFDVLEGLGPASLLFVAALVFVARPLAVWLSTAGSKLHWRERLFLMWMAPRGIVAAAIAAVLAIQLGDAGRPLVPLTFITIVCTVVIYGLPATLVAQWLGVAVPNPQGVLIAGSHELARSIATMLKSAGIRVLLVDTNHAEIRAARMADLPAYHGSILGDQALEEIDLGGIGRLIALTPNDEVNVLAVQRFRPLFGSAAVYQLPVTETATGRLAHARHLYGRPLFAPKATLAELQSRLTGGCVVKANKITESFDYAAFRELYPDALPLFMVSEGRRLSVFTAGQESGPQPGHTLISLVTPAPEKSPASPATER